MANPEHLAVLKQGVKAWNEWRADLHLRKANSIREVPLPFLVGSFREVDLSEADLSGVDLRGVELSEADLSKANLNGADLRGVDLSKANLHGADLSGADLKESRLGGANLRGADLSGADLRGGFLSEAALHEANLSGAKLGWAYLNGVNLSRANLSEADLRKANLSRANLSRVNLSRVNLSRADLREVNLGWADLRGADLNGADLRGADLSGADLKESRLGGANLRGADLSEADLSKADLSKVRLQGTILSNANLTESKGLDTCFHDGPSTLDLRTLQQSGPLPLAFLRGCGLPDLLIDNLPSLLNQPIQFYSCFISYSSKDEEFAQRLHADLQNEGVRCWFAPKDIQGGRKLHEQISDAIQLHEKLLLVLSDHSMNSEWVRTEIAEARQREVREKRQVLFPISLVDYKTIQQWKCFDADTGKDSAREIREYFIPDFSNWKSHNSAYQQAFDRLLRDLKPALERKPETS